MTKRIIILLVILALAVLLKLSFWADQRSVEVQGVTRMVAGPEGTIVMLTDEEILRVTADGELLANWSLYGIGIDGPIADLYAEADGSMLVGLIETQEIRRYASSGEQQGVFPRPPSPPRYGVPGQYEQNFKFTRDPGTGTLYVADSNHHRLQLYAPEGREITTLHTPAGSKPFRDPKEPPDDTLPKELDPDRPFLFPNSLIIDNDRLYATDTDNHRIVVFRRDGTLDRIIPTVKDRASPYVFPVHVARLEDRLFVINRTALFMDGDVVVLDQSSDQARRLYPRGLPIDPLDIILSKGDLLISDGVSQNVLRFSPEGFYLGRFGTPELQAVLEGKARSRANYTFIRYCSLGGMVLVLIGLLAMKRGERMERVQRGLPDEHQPIEAVRGLLGPQGSSRRRMLLILLPGIGHLAAGRILRALVLLPPLLILAGTLLVLLIMLPFQGVPLLPVVVLVAIATAAVWTGIVLDGFRLTGASPVKQERLTARQVLAMLGTVIVTVLAGGAAQLTWEYGKKVAPELSFALQGHLGDIMLRWGFASESTAPFAAMTPAGRFLGWGGAMAGMFGALSWTLEERTVKTIRAVVMGFVAGMLSWLFTAVVPGSWLGGAYYMPLSQGLLIGAALALVFRGALVPASVVLLAVAGAWTGNMMHLFFRFDLPFMTLPGASIRTTAVLFEAVGIHLAVLLLICIRERQGGSAAPVHGS